MTIEAWAYSSAAQVAALTRHLLDGETAYNEVTRPSLVEVERFINYASAELNTALAKAGFTTPVTQAVVVYQLDGWVAARAAMYAELTQRGAGYSDDEGSRTGAFSGLTQTADEYVMANAQGWQELGAAFTPNASAGLSFTALDTHTSRIDPNLATREQPLFRRRQFDRGGYSREL